MKTFLHAAYVIGRRDFVASVFSRSFLFFLIGPLIIILMSAGFGSITQNVARQNARTVVAVIATKQDQMALDHARARLVSGFSEGSIPSFRYFDPEPDVDRQVHRLLESREERAAGVLSGGLANPRMTGPMGGSNPVHRQVRLIVNQARQEQLLLHNGLDWQPTRVPITSVNEAAGPIAAARAITATGGQFIIFFLTVLLSGMLLSNLLEEKSNKIIEVLAAAVPVDAIFLGKVVSMLAISLTGIAVWTSAALLGGLALGGGGTRIPEPAVGWPAFVALVILYFSINYLLLGALFLGIGSQANTVREVQTMSMPITVGQMLIFALAIAGAAAFNGPFGLVAAIFPFSSPLMMVARAAQAPDIWPHLLALLWQGLWVWMIVRFGAALFRRNVLKSGPAFGRTKHARRGA